MFSIIYYVKKLIYFLEIKIKKEKKEKKRSTITNYEKEKELNLRNVQDTELFDCFASQVCFYSSLIVLFTLYILY
jgi:hypothetical protein